MNRSEFVRVVADRMKEDYPGGGVTYNEAKIWATSVLDILGDVIVAEDSLIISGLGTFKKVKRKESRRLDINTREIVVDPPRTKIKFVPSTVLEGKVKEK